MRLWIAVALLVALPLTSAAEDPLSKALENPPATGFLVTSVGPGSQAAAAGISPGDILLAYGGVPTEGPEEIAAAKKLAGDAEAIAAVIVHPGGEHEVVTLEPGPIGIDGLAVRKGEKPSLPAATVTRIDLSALAAAPLDHWQAFSLDGKTKVGFEHAVATLADGRLVLRREVAFDGGERWGVNHFVVDVVAEVGDGIVPVSTRFENPAAGWVGEGKRVEGDGGAASWRFHAEGGGAEPMEAAATLPADALPEYLPEVVVRFLPREKGACYRFRPLSEGMGAVGLPAALVGAGEEELEHRGKKVTAFRFDQQRIGGTVTSRYWLGADGELLRVAYGTGAFGLTCTKEEALADLHPDLEPKTAE